MDKITNSLFIELLKVAIGKRKELSQNPSLEQWKRLLQMSQEQAVAGICFSAIEILYDSAQRPPQELTLEWIGLTEQIKARNRVMNEKAVEISVYFKKNGFHSCILKGQGNALYYPNPLLRNSGDIDIWLDGTKEEIISFVRERYLGASECGWHIDFPMFGDAPVEVHFIPSYLRSPKHNARIQKYFEENKEKQFTNEVQLSGQSGGVSIPTAEFSLFQQISHVMRHFFIEGVGMRQIMDLYYLLARCGSELEKDRVQELLSDFGMMSFARGIMWILQHVFSLEEKALIAVPDRRRGQLLLDEIMNGGNWGRYDKKRTALGRINGLLPYMVRNAKFVFLFPYEAIVVPLKRRLEKG